MSEQQIQPEPEQAAIEPSLLQQKVRGYGHGLLRLGGCIAGAGIVLYPLMNDVGLKFAKVDTEVATFPATLTYTGNGATSVSTGALGTAFVNKTQGGIGMDARINTVTAEDTNFLISDAYAKMLASLYNSPDQAVDGYKHLLYADAKKWALSYEIGGALLLGAAAFSVTENIRRQRRLDGKEQFSQAALVASWLATVGIATVTVANPIGSHIDSEFSRQGPNVPDTAHRYSIAQLRNTPLADMYTDSEPIQSIVERLYPKFEEYRDRGNERGEAYAASAIAQLEAQKSLISLPREDEITFMATSDEHLNMPALKVMRHQFATINDMLPDDKKMEFSVSFGDTGYEIKPSFLSEPFFKSFAQLVPDGKVVVVPGNHNGEGDDGILEHDGALIADGEVIDFDDTKLLGIADPRHTPWFGQTEPDGIEGDQAEIEAGQKAREIADEEGVDIVMLHEPLAAAAFIGEDSASDFIAAGATQDYTQPYEDGVPDVSADLIGYGHSHNTRPRPIRVIWNSDGSWSVFFESGTSGGAISDPTPGDFSVPFEPPKKLASFVQFYKNKTSGLITGYQRYMLYPDGKAVIEPRVDIGSPDGQPFTLLPLRNKFNDLTQDTIRFNAGNKTASVRLKPGASARSQELFQDMRRLSTNGRG
jgi:hypothetical protein